VVTAGSSALVPMGGKGQLGAGPLMEAVDAGRGTLAFTGAAA
jgi:hypothetical protein